MSNLWVLLWVWLLKMNNVASSNSFPTSESSFCPPSGFARDFVGRTWSGERRDFFCRCLEVKRTWKDQSWSKSPNLVKDRNFWVVLAPQQISLIFMSKFSRNLVICKAFLRFFVFCNFLIWTPFPGQPWTNLIFSHQFLVFVFEINLRSQIPKPPSPVQEPRKIPQMIHQNSIGFQNPKNSSNSQRKSLHSIQPKKSIKTHQIFLQNSLKVAAQKKSTNFPRNDSEVLW